jgi:hypothetical protein
MVLNGARWCRSSIQLRQSSSHRFSVRVAVIVRRYVCCSDGWLEFERPTYSNEELMRSVMTVPRYVNNISKPEDKDDEGEDKVVY